MAMTGFFMLSGYSLQISYGGKSINNKLFYLKRFISVYPIYIITGSLFAIMCVVAGIQTVADNILLLPVEILGIQSIFDGSLFPYSHNSGSWFISCILICYLVYPFLKELFSRLPSKMETAFVLFLLLLLSYAHWLPEKYEVGNLYSNAFLRVMEFACGMLLASINNGKECDRRWLKWIRSNLVLACVSIVVTIGLSIGYHFEVYVDYLFYFGFFVIFLSLGINHQTRSFKESRVLLYTSSLTYAFYLGQFFVWYPAKFALLHIKDVPNIILIATTLAACLVISVALHEVVEKRLYNYLRLKLIQ